MDELAAYGVDVCGNDVDAGERDGDTWRGPAATEENGYPCISTPRADDGAKGHNERREELPHMPRPVAWLKLSMTLVFAVGVAIRDGPASLFRPGQSYCSHDTESAQRANSDTRTRRAETK